MIATRAYHECGPHAAVPFAINQVKGVDKKVQDVNKGIQGISEQVKGIKCRQGGHRCKGTVVRLANHLVLTMMSVLTMMRPTAPYCSRTWNLDLS